VPFDLATRLLPAFRVSFPFFHYLFSSVSFHLFSLLVCIGLTKIYLNSDARNQILETETEADSLVSRSIVHCMVPHHLTWRRRSHVSPTCRTDAGSGPPPLNSLTSRPVVSQLSEVVPVAGAKVEWPRRCRCSRTGWRHTCSAAATKLFDFNDISFS